MKKRNVYFVIPARKYSKRFPFKNRKLLDYTITEIPKNLHKKTIVTTDDEFIINKLANTEIKILKRDGKLSSDNASIKDVVHDVIKQFKMNSNDTIVLLDLTKLERKFKDVKKILGFYNKKGLKTLLCCVKPKTHPYLCFYKKKGGKGEPVVKHNLYRMQDYPECFKISHFVCIFQVSEISKLNNAMYNDSTFYYGINNEVDVDSETDLEEFLKS